MDLFIPFVWVILRYGIILLDRRGECVGYVNYVLYVASIFRHAPSGDVEVEPKYEVKSSCTNFCFFSQLAKESGMIGSLRKTTKECSVGEETKFEVPVIKQGQRIF